MSFSLIVFERTKFPDDISDSIDEFFVNIGVNAPNNALQHTSTNR